MKVFRIIGSQDYWSIDYNNITDIKNEKYLAEFKGMSVAKDWKKLEAKVVFKGERSNIKPDIMDVGGLVGFAITSSVKDVLKDLLAPYCELLPLDLEGEEIYLINPIIILDCLDYDNCVTKLYPPMYRTRIVKYELKKELRYPPIFRIKAEPSRSFGNYITDEVVKVLTENHIIGYNITEIWNSEE